MARLTNTGKTPCNDSNDGDEASVKNKYVKHLLLKVYDYEINSRLWWANIPIQLFFHGTTTWLCNS